MTKKKQKEPFISPEAMARIKSFAWRAAGMAAVAGLTYILKIGSVWSIDGKVLVDTMFIVLAGLLVGEITKHLNNRLSE